MDFKNIENYLNLNNHFISKSEDLNKPKLVEPGVKYFFKNILKECHAIKMKHYNIYYNIILAGLFFGILGIILCYRYKGKKTKEEQYRKTLKDKQYIMSKLVYYNRQDLDNKQKIRNNMITNLPDYGNHPEAAQLHRKIYF